MVEEWRDVTLDGYGDKYEVSNTGKVRSKPRTIKASNRLVNYKGKELKPNLDSGNYLQVCLCDHTRRKTVTVHSLVAEAFIGPRPDGMDVCHWDGDKANNHVENLRYGSRQENVFDNIRLGTHNWIVNGELDPPGRYGYASRMKGIDDV